MLPWTLGWIYPFKLIFLFSSDIYPVVKLLFLILWGNSIPFSIVSTIYSPNNCVLGFHFLHVLISFFICRLPDNSHFDRYEVISYCDFDHKESDMTEWTELMISDIEHFFICLLAIHISSLEKCLPRSLAIF